MNDLQQSFLNLYQSHSEHRQRPLSRALRAMLLGGALSASVAHAAPPVIPLSGLNGSNGFRLDGVDAEDFTGSASFAGDINGDGIDDLIIGAGGADPSGSESGTSYVVFGRSTGRFAPALDLSTLDGSTGFRLDGVAPGERSGDFVSALGDINGDGIDDLIIGAYGAAAESGRSYVVFGRSAGFESVISLSTLDGVSGFRLDGVAPGDRSGLSVSGAGDINGDGIDDLIIGADRADPNGPDSGSSYVVFGRDSGFSSVISLATLNGSNGFRLDGVNQFDNSGIAVSGAGDINSDGIDDLIIGAFGADPFIAEEGSSYVVFGRSMGGFDANINLSSLDGSNGFRLDGILDRGFSGISVSSAGDINSDGIDDLVIGANSAGHNGFLSGSSYVVFGLSTGFPPVVSLSVLDGSNGFRLDGVAGSGAGGAVSAAGDINGDGIDDLLVAAAFGDETAFNSGSGYVVFGRSTAFAPVINLSTLDGGNGFRVDGVAAEDLAGLRPSSPGDFNGDGIDDLIIGAPGANVNTGSSYLVFGSRERVFRDGSEDQNIDVRFPHLDGRNSSLGSSVSWENGATCHCNNESFNFNFHSEVADLVFTWPASGIAGGVASGTVYTVLQPGAVIGPSSEFSTSPSAPATLNWRAGVEGYLGFRFVNSTGMLNYGYARIRTTAPTGYPIELISFGVNLTGEEVTIPSQ